MMAVNLLQDFMLYKYTFLMGIAGLTYLSMRPRLMLSGAARQVMGDLMAARMDALSRLSASSEAIAFASIFIMLLFIAIETAPIFVKLIAHKSPYDFLIDEKEHVFSAVMRALRTSVCCQTPVQSTIPIHLAHMQSKAYEIFQVTC